MPRHRLPGIGEQVPLFVALPSSLPVEGYVHGRGLVQKRRFEVWFEAQAQYPPSKPDQTDQTLIFKTLFLELWFKTRLARK
jgi:hypothetical protein